MAEREPPARVNLHGVLVFRDAEGNRTTDLANVADAEAAEFRRINVADKRVINGKIEQQLQRDSGMPHTYFEILVRLSVAPDGRLRMSELAARSNSSQSRLSHMTARLEQRGWIRRERAAERQGLHQRRGDTHHEEGTRLFRREARQRGTIFLD